MSVLGDRLDGPRVRLEADGTGNYRILRMLDGTALGRITLEESGNALFVRAICIDAPHRGFGAGTGAATLLREAAEAAGTWRYLRAWAPPDTGLAVYFWSRMGLRPIPGDGPNGGLLLEREL